MPNSINAISEINNIRGTSGSFDFAAEDKKQERLLEDTRHLTAGGKGAAGTDPRVKRVATKGPQNRGIQLPNEPELTPAPTSLNDSIFKSEASGSDQRNGTMTAYFNKATNEYSIGPGLNVDSPVVRKSLAKKGFDSQKLKDIYDFKSETPIDQELVPMMREVFNEAVDNARKDARKFVGSATWNKLKQNEKDAISDMSYNLGLSRLGGFKNMKKAIEALVNNRSPEALNAVTEQMIDSRWYSQVGNRATKIINLFHNGEDSDTKRWNELRGQPQA